MVLLEIVQMVFKVQERRIWFGEKKKTGRAQKFGSDALQAISKMMS